jgi:hypothetical protein
MPIIVALSQGDSYVECDNVTKHGIATKRDQYRYFNAKKPEWAYWTKLSFAGKREIASTYFDKGTCVLCIIDGKLSK